MKTLNIQGRTGNSIILIGETLHSLRKYVRAENAVIITDGNVLKYYGDQFPPYKVIEIGTGERIKNWGTIDKIFSKFVEFEVDRMSYIVGIGGGVVCDISGFAASIYMRGVRFGFVSTTLLSQVDASVGGKNGVNFHGYKNMIGVFNQPEFVICDINLLKTLTKREVLCGMAEIIKHALIADPGMFFYLERNLEKALLLEKNIIEKLVHDSVRIKSDIVNMDEKERGERRKLNLGHTFGHAIEKSAGVPHGEAVSMGMMVAARLSVKKGYLTSEELLRIEGLLGRFGLPTKMLLDKEKIIDAVGKDKKREGRNIFFVLLNGIGDTVVEEIPLKEFEELMNEIAVI
ncbi:MAG: 3-dehydroquinate synthase [Deltaproteobacteria bacterium]|nr:3-dehydroquinate synthase [Deltaproteobacteria bacterium]